MRSWFGERIYDIEHSILMVFDFLKTFNLCIVRECHSSLINLASLITQGGVVAIFLLIPR